MRAKMWWQAFTAVFAAARKRTPAQDEALRAERARGVGRLGEDVAGRDGRTGQAGQPSSRPARSRRKQGQ